VNDVEPHPTMSSTSSSSTSSTGTADLRRDRNRRNARKSTGPRTEAGKLRSRDNALRHGLRADARPLPGEDAAAVAGRAAAWHDHYTPATPAAAHLVNECVRATLLADRLGRYHDAEVARQVRAAGDRWEQAREDEVSRLVALLATDPATAARLLPRTSHGCRYLLARWEHLAERLAANGSWAETERDEATRLLGHRPDPAHLRACPEAWLIRLQTLRCRSAQAGPAVGWLFDPARLPDVYRAVYREDWLPDAEDSRASLAAMAAERLGPLRELAEALEDEVDRADRDGAADRALVIHDPIAADRFLRYHAESRNAFHRAHVALVRARRADDQDDDDPDRAEAAPDDAGADPTADTSRPEPAALPAPASAAQPADSTIDTSRPQPAAAPAAAASNHKPTPRAGESALKPAEPAPVRFPNEPTAASTAFPNEPTAGPTAPAPLPDQAAAGPTATPIEAAAGPIRLPNEAAAGPIHLPNEATAGPMRLPNEATAGVTAPIPISNEAAVRSTAKPEPGGAATPVRRPGGARAAAEKTQDGARGLAGASPGPAEARAGVGSRPPARGEVPPLRRQVRRRNGEEPRPAPESEFRRHPDPGADRATHGSAVGGAPGPYDPAPAVGPDTRPPYRRRTN